MMISLCLLVNYAMFCAGRGFKCMVAVRMVHYRLPYRVLPSEAYGIFVENKAGTEGIVGDPFIEGILLPHYIGGIERIECSYEGQCGVLTGKTDWHFDGKRMVPHYYVSNDWYGVRDSLTKMRIGIGHEMLNVYAGDNCSAEIVKEVNHFRVPVDELVKEDGDGQEIYKEDTGTFVDGVRGAMIKIVNEWFEDLALADLKVKYKADNYRIESINCNMSELEIKKYYMPGYICWYKVGGKYYYKIINGYTGKISGRLTYGAGLMGKFGIGIGGVSGIGLGVIGVDIAVASMLCLGVIPVVMAVSSLAYNKWNHYYYVAKYQEQLERSVQYLANQQHKRNKEQLGRSVPLSGVVEKEKNNVVQDSGTLVLIEKEKKNVIQNSAALVLVEKEKDNVAQNNGALEVFEKEKNDGMQNSGTLESIERISKLMGSSVDVSSFGQEQDTGGKYMVKHSDMKYLKVLELQDRTWITQEVLDEGKLKALGNWETHNLGRKKSCIIAEIEKGKIVEAYNELSKRFV